MANTSQDRIEETYGWLPRAEDITPDKVFVQGEGTAKKLQQALGMSLSTAGHNLARLKRQERAHIHTWTTAKTPAAVWVKGPGEDAPMPESAPAAELARRRHERFREREKTRRAAVTEFGQSIMTTAATIEKARAKPAQWWSSLGDMPTEGAA